MSKIEQINLSAIAIRLLNNQAIKAKLDKPLIFSANNLANKIPELKQLGELALIQLRKTDNGYLSLIPSLYSLEEKIIVVMPNRNADICNDFSVLNWQGGELNQAVLKHKKLDITIIGSVAFKSDSLDDFKVDFQNHIEGEGINGLNPIWLKPAPQLEIPLRELPLNKPIKVINDNHKRSKKYQTKLIDLECEGVLLKNVITNSDLRLLIDDGCKKFEITEVKVINTKTGNQHQIMVNPLDGIDFSDLKLAS